MVSEGGVERVETARTRSARGNVVFAFAIALALATAYLMRQILMLLYVSALFAVVLSPVIRAITRTPRWEVASRPGAGDLSPVAEPGGGGDLVFRFRFAASVTGRAIPGRGAANARPAVARSAA